MHDWRRRFAAARHWLKLRQKALYRWAHVVVPLALLVVAVRMKVSERGWVEWVQNRSFDTLQQLRPRPYEALPVRILDIDDETLAKLGQWPWPRTLLARLVTRLSDLGVSVVAFDAVFAEPDRTSPARAVETWQQTGDLGSLRASIERLPDHDRLFAQAIAKANVVLGFPLIGDVNRVKPAVKVTFNSVGHNPVGFLRSYPGAVANLPVLEKAAAGVGNFGFTPDSDGTIRRVPLLFRKDDDLYPALSIESLRAAQGLGAIAIKTSGASGETKGFGEDAGIRMIKVGQSVIPVDAQGRFWVYFTADAPGRAIPVWKVLEKKFDRSLVEGTIMFVGTSAAGLKDLRVTPLSPAAPGVEIHANVVEQVLLGSYLRRPDIAVVAETFYMIAFGLILLVLLPRLGAAWCALVSAGGIWVAVYVSWRAFVGRGYLVDPIFPSLTVLAIYMSSSLISFMKVEAERRHLRGTLSRYMSPKLAEEIAKHPERLKLGGETRTMTFHFCDIRGFTTISEQFDPHGLTQFINKFLTPMTDLIFLHNGTIDKYMGDCIMAFWNAPLDDNRHAENACKAALAMHARLRELNAQWEKEAKETGKKFIPIHIGTGLNTGPCVVGNMGSDQRFDYSVLGDDVNLASRLEGQSKTYGVDIVVGPLTKDSAPDFAFLELDLIKVKGKTKPVRIYALLGDSAMKLSQEFRDLEGDHQRMLSAYRHKNWDHAHELVEKCRACPLKLEKLYHLYEDRIALYREQSPGEDWDGTFTATTK